jgi:hypothetical protein
LETEKELAKDETKRGVGLNLRDIAYFAERLFGYFLLKKTKSGNVKYLETPTLYY